MFVAAAVMDFFCLEFLDTPSDICCVYLTYLDANADVNNMEWCLWRRAIFGALLCKGYSKTSCPARGYKDDTSFRNKPYEERLARLNLFSLDERRLRGKIIECFKVLKRFTNMDASKMFSIDNTPRTRSNGVKLRCKQVQVASTKFLFTNEVVKEWFKPPPSVVQCDTINSFKNKLDHHLLNQDIR